MTFNGNQTIAFLTAKMKTFTTACIKPRYCSRSIGTPPETLFVRPCYIESRHFGQKRHFMFSEIAP